SEAGAYLLGQEFRLFPRGKVPAFIELVVVNQFGVRALCPTARAQIDLIRKGTHGNRDRNALDVEIPEFVFPVETRSGNRRIRQPGQRNVVEDIVPAEAGRFSS